MERKIYHIAPDEKFINSGFQQFEAIRPNGNTLLIYGVKDGILKHITIDKSKRRFIELNPNTFKNIPRNSIVIFHSIPDYILNFLPYLPPEVVIIGSVFGYETYEDKLFYPESILYDKITRSLFHKSNKFSEIKERIKYRVFPILRKINSKKFYITKTEIDKVKKLKKKELLSRINLLCLPYYEELKSQERILKMKFKLFEFCYYPLEKILNVDSPVNMNKDTILIGHSGNSNGNHLDILNKVYEVIPKDLKIKIPFSYGKEIYIERTTEIIEKTYPNVLILRNFMKIEDYNGILNSTKIAIFNNRRQQGMGNIISLLYFGAKVFLSKYNSLYLFFKNHGAVIYCYENELTKDSFMKGLSEEEILKNRNLLKQLFSSDVLRNKLLSNFHKIDKYYN